VFRVSVFLWIRVRSKGTGTGGVCRSSHADAGIDTQDLVVDEVRVPHIMCRKPTRGVLRLWGTDPEEGDVALDGGMLYVRLSNGFAVISHGMER
jgi:hypothetical protein